MKKTIKDFDLSGKKVIIRCDLNVPMNDNIISDDTRIKSSLRTIKYAIKSSARVILLSHLGKVKTEEDKSGNSLYPVSKKLSEYLHKEVFFSKETRGKSLENMINLLKDGDVLLVENTRFEDIDGKKESNCDEDLSKYWASLGDIFINDAYGSCHRNHASVTGIPKYIPSGLGFLTLREVQKLDGILKSKTHPFIVVMGGKKIEDKIPVIENLITKCDRLLIGGAMSFTFLKSEGYNVGLSLVYNNHIDFCKEILNKYPEKIILPVDFLVSNDNENIEVKDIASFDDDDIGYDIGPNTIKIFEKELKSARRVIMNGTMGMFEDKRFAKGTKEMFKFLNKNKIKTLIGGGDTASSVNKLGYNDSFYHVSTGGGATLKYLGDGSLIGIEVIEDEKE